MTTPRLVSLTALVASLLFVVMTIAQANGYATPPNMAAVEHFCIEAGDTQSCMAPSVAFLTH